MYSTSPAKIGKSIVGGRAEQMEHLQQDRLQIPRADDVVETVQKIAKTQCSTHGASSFGHGLETLTLSD